MPHTVFLIMVVLVLLLFGGQESQAFSKVSDARIGGAGKPAGFVARPGIITTLHYNNLSIQQDIGTHPNYDAMAWFANVGSNPIPPGWVDIGGSMQFCYSAITNELYGNNWNILIRNLNGQIIFQQVGGMPSCILGWGESFVQAAHLASDNSNPPRFDPDEPQDGCKEPCKEDGDPVDLGTGLFLLKKTDLVLPDVLPIVLTRTYRQNDPVSRLVLYVCTK